MRHGDTEHRIESLPRLVTEANALALVGLANMGSRCKLPLDPEADKVFVDRIQIQQVLFNLIRNSIDAMVDSPVRCLTIPSDRRRRDSSHSASRIPAPALAKRLRRNCFSHSSRRRRQAWASDYLSVGRSSRPMAAGSGSSRGRQGTVFKVYAADRGDDDHRALTLRIVHLVDDDAAIRRSVGFMLKTSGYQVQAYESGVELLKHAGELRQGCILLDIRMAGMDGLEVQQALQEKGVTLPVIIMTGHGDVSLAVKSNEGRCHRFHREALRKGNSEIVARRGISAALAKGSDG